MPRPTIFRTRRMREQAEKLLNRARFLDPLEREMMEQIFDRGVSPTAIARQAGRNPATIRRKVHRTIHRLTDPRNVELMRRHERLEPTLRRLSILVFFRGRSIRAAAKELKMSYAEARRHVDALTLSAESSLQTDAPRHRHGK